MRVHSFDHFHLGWKPPLPGQRPRLALASHPAIARFAAPLPARADVMSTEPDIWNQEQEGSCTAHGSLANIVSCLLRLRVAGVGKSFLPSRQAQYNWTRLSESTFSSDSGASVYDAVSILQQKGFAMESSFAYSQENLFVEPPATLPIHGHSLDAYGVDMTLDAIRASIAVLGAPVVFGATVYPEIQYATVINPIVPMPKRGWWIFGNESPEGGHCIEFVGYDDGTRLLRFRNSWGPAWGEAGYGYFHYDYLPYCSDGHVIDKAQEQ